MEVKYCSRCSQIKPVSEFYTRVASPDGLQIWCKVCMHEHNHKRHAQNRASEAEYSRKYRRNHAEACNESNRRYRERKTAAGGDYSAMDAARCLAFFDYRCAYSGEPLGNDYQFDHVVPVSKGGSSDIRNLVPCTPTINQSKAANNVDEWYARQPFYSPERHDQINKWISER